MAKVLVREQADDTMMFLHWVWHLQMFSRLVLYLITFLLALQPCVYARFLPTSTKSHSDVFIHCHFCIPVKFLPPPLRNSEWSKWIFGKYQKTLLLKEQTFWKRREKDSSLSLEYLLRVTFEAISHVWRDGDMLSEVMIQNSWILEVSQFSWALDDYRIVISMAWTEQEDSIFYSDLSVPQHMQN